MSNWKIKPIETVYNGYRFRSRLEARWAVFFDTLQIRYQYEVEGFDLDGVWYLPDFWLPDYQTWFEVKGESPDQEATNKALRLGQTYPVIMAIGECWSTGEIVLFGQKGMLEGSGLWVCPECRGLALVTTEGIICILCWKQTAMEFAPAPPTPIALLSGYFLFNAFTAARQARFGRK